MNQEIVDALGLEWKSLPESERHRTRLTDRRHHIDTKLHFIKQSVPEYLDGPPRQVIDFSAGNGVLLEIFRHFGHQVWAVDIQYFDFFRSQGIPFVGHDCRILPYPFEDNSCDLITCVGSLSTYGNVPWGEVVSEFARIARQCVVVLPNHGEVLDARRGELDSWYQRGWDRVELEVEDIWKWQNGCVAALLN